MCRKNVVFCRRNLEAEREGKAAKRQRTRRRCEFFTKFYMQYINQCC